MFKQYQFLQSKYVLLKVKDACMSFFIQSHGLYRTLTEIIEQ